MLLDTRLAQELKETRLRLLAEGKLPAAAKLQQYYDKFRQRFGPERLRSLDGEVLLNEIYLSGTYDNMAYWLEFKNDDEFPAIFGSISGGSALKFGMYFSQKTGQWMGQGKGSNPIPIELDEAIAIARKHREQFLKGVELLTALPVDGTDEDYRKLQLQMDTEALDVSRLAWGHKYFSLIFPDKLDDYHNESFQRFFLVKLLQVPPEGAGRYLCAGRFVAISRELDMPLNHLTTVLNQLIGKPYKYWRIGTSIGEGERDIWADMRAGGFIAIGWPRLGDLSAYPQNAELVDYLKRSLAEQYPNSPSVISRKAAEIRNFVNAIGYYLSKRDLVLAADGEKVLGIGRVTGDYEYVPGSEFPHRHRVEWLNVDQWKLPERREGLRTTVFPLAVPANLVEIERKLLHHEELLSPTDGGEPRVPQLGGISARIQAILERKGQVILYGPPGTGKTYWAEVTARELAARNVCGRAFDQLSTEQQRGIWQDGYVRLCSFHPSYGYEDFLEGYRPQVLQDQMTFTRHDGVFKTLCQDALAQPERQFYLIIDEINRGDIPRIFGELLTVLEKDKRGIEIVLPLSREPFRVPRNVYLIGTMNTADRSIALLDTALRRRFGFVELMPDYGMLENAVVESIPLGPWLEALNRRIVEHVGRDARNLQIGHAYLLEGGKPVSNVAKFVRVVQEDIIPLLEEYCYEDYIALEKILGTGLVDVHDQRVRHELFDPTRQDDLVQALISPAPEITTSIQAVTAHFEDVEEEKDIETDGDQ